jgi:radical SAM superfamily enzyme YgiQ (UPF0313 family)/protein-L-isoaspartate O-methyltransferase
VLLISPGIIKPTDLDFGLPHLVSIGGYLQREHPVRVEILDLAYEAGDYRQLERTLGGLEPFLLIGISCYSSFDYLRVVTLARFFRERYPKTPLVCGGYHASALPADLVGEGRPFTAVIQGEGERPLGRMVQTLLGGAPLEPGVHGPDVVDELDSLPPYRWELLERYWPRARRIGRKLQIYLSRGCPFHCTFCMERAKQSYRWRAYSPERAVDELARLARVTPLRHWVVNVADPLFGFKRRWRRQVLELIIRRELRPRQYWTLTRANELEDGDIELLARARFSVGVGIESGSPEMLALMQKTARPGRYLETLERFAALSEKHALNWSGNVVVGHPGETPATMAETHRFIEGLLTGRPTTRGWVSVDPFRLYPGSQVHVEQRRYTERYGTRFFHPRWWESWYDGGFRAEHVDPSAALDFERRVRFTHDRYLPLAEEIARRFRGQGRSIDAVFERSVNEQVALLSAGARDQTLARGRAASKVEPSTRETLPLPIGLNVRDPWVRRREEAVRRLLARGVLRSERVIEALLAVAPEAYVEQAEAMLADRSPDSTDGAGWLPVSFYGLALEALDLRSGDRAADLLAARGYLAALLARVVGARGEVVAVSPGPRRRTKALRGQLDGIDNVCVVQGAPTTAKGLAGTFDGLVLAGALPALPQELVEPLRSPGGRIVTLLGPRFRPQDLVCVTRGEDENNRDERQVARLWAPPLHGPNGWLRERP